MLPETEKIIQQLKSMSNPENVAGMARYGINPEGTLGISIYQLRPMAKQIKHMYPEKEHALALDLWDTGIHEAQLLAIFLDNPQEVTPSQMDSWAESFNSWDICDQACSSLFDQTPYAYDKANEWSERQEEFIKRAGFVLIAGLAVHDHKAPDGKLAAFFPLIVRHAIDERNFERKAVNWALRNIGKRNLALNQSAIDTAYQIQKIPSRSARWIASDALRELTSEKVILRLQKRGE